MHSFWKRLVPGQRSKEQTAADSSTQNLVERITALNILDNDLVWVTGEHIEEIGPDVWLALTTAKVKLTDQGKHVTFLITTKDINLETLPSSFFADNGYVRKDEVLQWLDLEHPKGAYAHLVESFSERFNNA